MKHPMAQFALEAIITMWYGRKARVDLSQPNDSKTDEFVSPSKLDQFGYFFSPLPSVGPMEQLHPLPVDEYWSVLKRAQLLRVFSQFRWRSMQDQRAKEVRQLVVDGIQADPRYEVTAKELQHNQLGTLLNSCAAQLTNAKDVQT